MIETGLAGTVVVVTGGASGIGAAVSRAFADQGAKVAVHYVDGRCHRARRDHVEHAVPARTAAETLVNSLPNARAFEADLSFDGSEVALIDAVSAAMGEIDVVINNAAHCESPDAYQGLSSASLERHYRVNAVAPGPVQTGWMSDELVDEVEAGIPLGRVGTPKDIADACVFLASHQARWITGQVLQVAGGHAL